MDIRYTYFPSVFRIDEFSPVTSSWEYLVARFKEHERITDKMKAPGFGPYVLAPTSEPCRAHKDGKVRVAAHRCDECVEEMTLALFDVDTGTQEDIEKCEELLDKAGFARLWYSSYSYVPHQDRPGMRLVIPFASPLNPKEWPSVRAALIYQYQIPCLVSACKGRSHLYFVPSCSKDATPIAFSKAGRFLNHETLPKVQEQKATSRHVSLSWSPPPEPEPGTPINVEPLREVIQQRRRRFSKGAPDIKYKGVLLERLLNGEALEEKGKRNDATTVVAGILAYALPEQPVSVLLSLMRPSLLQMQVSGSKLTEYKVEKMLLRSMRKKAEAEAAAKATEETLTNIAVVIRRNIPEGRL